MKHNSNKTGDEQSNSDNTTKYQYPIYFNIFIQRSNNERFLMQRFLMLRNTTACIYAVCITVLFLVNFVNLILFLLSLFATGCSLSGE